MGERKIHYVKLLETEARYNKEVYPGTIASFYDTDAVNEPSVSSIVDSLVERANGILRKNPWLCGRLVSNVESGDEVALVYSDLISDPGRYVQCLTNDELFETNANGAMEAIANTLPPKSGQCVNTDEPLCKFLVVRNNARSKLAAVFSLDHTTADGHTVYKIWKMWDVRMEIQELIIEREHDYFDTLERETSLPPINFVKSVMAMLLRGIGRTIRRKSKPAFRAYTINSEVLADRKRMHAGDDSFVSANDVINTWFFGGECFPAVDNVGMSVDMHNRLPIITDKMVGNYTAAAKFHTRDLKNPKLFRDCWKAQLYKGNRRESSVMSCFSTNVAKLYHHLDLTGLKHTHHFPFMEDVTKLPLVLGVPMCYQRCILIFKVNPDKYGVFMGIYDDVTEEDLEKCELLEKRI